MLTFSEIRWRRPATTHRTPAARRSAIRPPQVLVGTGIALTVMLCSAAGAGASVTFVGHFGSKGTGDGQFSGPAGAAFDPSSDNVYISDPGNSRVERFDATGTFLSSITRPGFTPGSVAVDRSNGDLYVGSQGGGSLIRFDSSGALQSEFSVPTSGFTAGIAVDSSQHAVWIKTGQSTINEYSSTGSLLRTVGGNDGNGQPTNQFGDVRGLGVDPATGQLYVEDFPSKRVQVFDSTGHFIRQFDTLSSDNNFSATALSIAPATGNVFITSSDNTVNVFSQSGTSLYRILPDNNDPATESLPGTLALGPSGDVYIPVTTASAIVIDHYREPIAPVVDSAGGSVSRVSSSSADVAGGVNPEGSPTTYHFEYFSASQSPDSPDRSPASPAADPSLPADTSNHPVSGILGGPSASSPLSPSTQYYWRVVATNAAGTTKGSIHGPFTTPAAATGPGGGGNPPQQPPPSDSNLNPPKLSASIYDATTTRDVSFADPKGITPHVTQGDQLSAGGQCGDVYGDGGLHRCYFEDYSPAGGQPHAFESDGTFSGSSLSGLIAADTETATAVGTHVLFLRAAYGPTGHAPATISLDYVVDPKPSPGATQAAAQKATGAEVAPVGGGLADAVSGQDRILYNRVGIPVCVLTRSGGILPLTVNGRSGSIIAAGSGNIIGAGAGNLITKGSLNYLITNPDGTIVGIIAAGSGNIIGAGAGNLISHDGGSVIVVVSGNGIIAAGSGNLVGPPIASGIIGAGAGNIIAAGSGNIIGAGAGNLVVNNLVGHSAAGIISSNNAGIINSGAFNFLPLDNSSLISDKGLGLISDKGLGLISDKGLGLISDKGLGLIPGAGSLAPLTASSLTPGAGLLTIGGQASAGTFGAFVYQGNALASIRAVTAAQRVSKRPAPLASGATYLARAGERRAIVIKYTAAGLRTLRSLAIQNARLKAHRRRLAHVSLTLVNMLIPAGGGRPITTTRTLAITPVAATKPPRHGHPHHKR